MELALNINPVIKTVLSALSNEELIIAGLTCKLWHEVASVIYANRKAKDPSTRLLLKPKLLVKKWFVQTFFSQFDLTVKTRSGWLANHHHIVELSLKYLNKEQRDILANSYKLYNPNRYTIPQLKRYFDFEVDDVDSRGLMCYFLHSLGDVDRLKELQFLEPYLPPLYRMPPEVIESFMPSSWKIDDDDLLLGNVSWLLSKNLLPFESDVYRYIDPQNPDAHEVIYWLYKEMNIQPNNYFNTYVLFMNSDGEHVRFHDLVATF